MVRVRIETRRLVLRTLEDSDVESVLAHRADPDVCRYTGPPMTREEVVRHIAERQRSWHGGGNGDVLGLACELKESGRVVGEGVLRGFSVPAKQAEVGLGLQPQHQARELGTEALVALLRYGFEQLGLHRIYAFCDVDNEASRRLTARLGMRHEGTLRENAFRHGQWRDELLISMLDREWESARPSFERFF
ncbi:GNAT family N-acetyltransferase [Archangium minus]|uniref:GNAT family N-acetyltransferase n=1 Tax=Archangium minus TaxID=83450 RepID=A0ABY9WLP3_9BACT|nr:GNAT family N-acetyltransferase [Archangium minus]